MMFCQSVAALGLGTKCTAIDTWEGDEQNGIYGPEVLSDLRGAHDPKYNAFSRLLQMDFDLALREFPDKSIDMLHIDGLHTYEAVRHDFETWVPKLSDRAVVLFHDTAVQENNFGVWKLWGEIAPSRPHFNVPYGFGLGILAVGKSVPTRFLDFLSALRMNHLRILPYFHALGQRVGLLRKCMAIGMAIHDIQVLVNQWREAHGDAINNATPDMAKARADPSFAATTRENVAELVADAVKIHKAGDA